MFGGCRADESADPEQGVGGEPVTPRMVEPLDCRDQTDATFLKQFGVGKPATRGKLSTDHADETQIGLDESLPRRRPLVFEKSQLLICGISEAGARYSRLSRQQSRLDSGLQLEHLGMGQQGFGRDIIESRGHAHTLRQSLPPATPTRGKSVDNSPCERRQSRAAQSVLGADAAGVQRLAACLQHHQLGKHLVVLVLFLNRVRTLQARLQRCDGTHHGEELESG